MAPSEIIHLTKNDPSVPQDCHSTLIWKKALESRKNAWYSTHGPAFYIFFKFHKWFYGLVNQLMKEECLEMTLKKLGSWKHSCEARLEVYLVLLYWTFMLTVCSSQQINSARKEYHTDLTENVILFGEYGNDLNWS